jgi:uncharacterized protein YndB with AHSA1/START domain
MGTTRVTAISRPRANVYSALLDPEAVRQWMVPDGMTSEIHSFDAREGGTFRISLSYDVPTDAGKTSAQTDSFHGRFVRLVPNTEVVQVVEFETDDPAMAGEMTITYLLADEEGGTDLAGVHENLPSGVPPADNELGWRMSPTSSPPLSRPLADRQSPAAWAYRSRARTRLRDATELPVGCPQRLGDLPRPSCQNPLQLWPAGAQFGAHCCVLRCRR